MYNVAKTISNGASTTPGATDAQKTDIKAVADDIIAKIKGTALFDVAGPTDNKYTLTYKSEVDATVKNFPMQQGLPAGAAVLTMATPGTPGSATAETSDAFTYSNNGKKVHRPFIKVYYFICASLIAAQLSCFADVSTSQLPDTTKATVIDDLSRLYLETILRLLKPGKIGQLLVLMIGINLVLLL